MRDAKETAMNLHYTWSGTDPVRTAEQVREAVVLALNPEEATDAEFVNAVVESLCPRLRHDGLLTDVQFER